MLCHVILPPTYLLIKGHIIKLYMIQQLAVSMALVRVSICKRGSGDKITKTNITFA